MKRSMALALLCLLLASGCTAAPLLEAPVPLDAAPPMVEMPTPETAAPPDDPRVMHVTVTDAKEEWPGLPRIIDSEKWAYTLLQVELSNGQIIERKFSDYRGGVHTFISDAYQVDLNADGRDEVIIYLEDEGSSQFGMGYLHIYRVEGGELVEYPKYISNAAACTVEVPNSFAPEDMTIAQAYATTIYGRGLVVLFWYGGDAVMTELGAHNDLRCAALMLGEDGWELAQVADIKYYSVDKDRN
ncbi:MAG: hypothetical protein LBN26_03245 [Christensenellaceae bacterium]|jgi:hypothetical protein|nr:hypothetical protein [Christensenellaceae bacterium]